MKRVLAIVFALAIFQAPHVFAQSTPWQGGGGSGCTVAGTANQIVSNTGSAGCQASTATATTGGIVAVPGTGAASTPGLSVTGAPFTGGTATTNFPQLYINDGTGPTTFSASGTEFGINTPSGFSGNLLDFHVNGGTSLVNLTATGLLALNNTAAGDLQCGNGSGGCRIISGSPSSGVYFQAGNGNPFKATSTGISTTSAYQLGSNTIISGTLPTISAAGGLGSAPSIATNGTAAMDITAGSSTSAASFTIGLPTATTGWVCTGNDITTISAAVSALHQTGGSTTSAVMALYSDISVIAAPVAADHIRISCMGY